MSLSRLGTQMADFLTQAERSARMGRIRSKNTKPEMRVRKLVHALGFRYRLHRRDLPGVPDLVFPSRRKVIFVHGCYWHLHEGCRHYRLPTARKEFWMGKLEANRLRDERNEAELRRLGWDVLVTWECQTKPRVLDQLADRVVSFLKDTPQRKEKRNGISQ